MTTEQRTKLILEPNVSQEITMLYDEAQVGEGKFGTWWRWTVEVEGEETSWFTSERLQNLLAGLPITQGTVLIVTERIKKTDDNKFTYYDVEMDGELHSTADVDVAEKAPVKKKAKKKEEAPVASADFTEDEKEVALKDVTDEWAELFEEVDDTQYKKLMIWYERASKDIFRIQDASWGKMMTAESLQSGTATILIQLERMGILKS